jgi:hypothetical protein
MDILNWIKSWFGPAKFLSSHTVQTSLLQDMDPVYSYPTIQNHALDVSSDLAIGSKVGLGKPNFPHPTPSKPACCKTQSPWIPFPTIPNHALDVSSGLACF